MRQSRINHLAGAFACASIAACAQSARAEWLTVAPEWTEISIPETARPSARYTHAMAHYPTRNQIVLFGGTPGPETWTFDLVLNTWNQQFAQQAPGHYNNARMAYDDVCDCILVFGGEQNAPNEYSNQLWAWNGEAWAEVPKSEPWPQERTGHSLVYDSLRHVAVLFGGVDTDGNALSDTWEWSSDSEQWIQRAPATQPSPRTEHAMAFDPTSGTVVLFGGSGPGPRNGLATMNDTWVWNGDSGEWSQAAPEGDIPPSRRTHDMVYYGLRGRTVMYGGWNKEDGDLGDTWEWNGLGWSQVNTTGSPGARQSFAMVSDDIQGVVVVFGGTLRFGPNFNDTWRYRACRAGDCDGDAVPDIDDQCPLTPAPAGSDAMGHPLGDLDQDCDVDLIDFTTFSTNFSGSI